MAQKFDYSERRIREFLNYINENMTVDEMGETLVNAGFGFVLDESGIYMTTDGSIRIFNTDIGGCELLI